MALVGFVEVVQTEEQVTLRRCPHPEVQEMRVAAGLHTEAARRRPGEVGGHHDRRTAQERQRRSEHPAVTDRK
jgi:hypothetical protein